MNWLSVSCVSLSLQCNHFWCDKGDLFHTTLVGLAGKYACCGWKDSESYGSECSQPSNQQSQQVYCSLFNGLSSTNTFLPDMQLCCQSRVLQRNAFLMHVPRWEGPAISCTCWKKESHSFVSSKRMRTTLVRTCYVHGLHSRLQFATLSCQSIQMKAIWDFGTLPIHKVNALQHL